MLLEKLLEFLNVRTGMNVSVCRPVRGLTRENVGWERRRKRRRRRLRRKRRRPLLLRAVTFLGIQWSMQPRGEVKHTHTHTQFSLDKVDRDRL